MKFASNNSQAPRKRGEKSEHHQLKHQNQQKILIVKCCIQPHYLYKLLIFRCTFRLFILGVYTNFCLQPPHFIDILTSLSKNAANLAWRNQKSSNHTLFRKFTSFILKLKNCFNGLWSWIPQTLKHLEICPCTDSDAIEQVFHKEPSLPQLVFQRSEIYLLKLHTVGSCKKIPPFP